MIEREYGVVLKGLLKRFPAVTILGPRQCGKTTFIRRALPDWLYLDLERPGDAAPMVSDPEARLSQLGDGIVIDEAQSVPGLFPVLRGVIDGRRSRRGRFVLLGSASPALISRISESLAGRTAFMDMAPFRWREVGTGRSSRVLDVLWYRGGFPDAYLEKADAARWEWFEAYTRAFIERDLNVLGIDVSSPVMRRLWTMMAHVNGGLWNASQMAASLGVSYHTVNRYVDILEQTFLVRRLLPYHANVGKRLVKSPKVYFRDTGLLHFFLGIGSQAALETHPARGASWEAFIVDQLISACGLRLPGARPYFFRTSRGDEVDLALDLGSRRVLFEIKLHSAPTAEHTPGLARCMRDLKESKAYVVYPGTETYSLGRGITALPAAKLLMEPRLLDKVLEGE